MSVSPVTTRPVTGAGPPGRPEDLHYNNNQLCPPPNSIVRARPRVDGNFVPVSLESAVHVWTNDPGAIAGEVVSQGLSNMEIADRLSIRETTVRNHVSNLFDTLGVWTRAQAIVFANERGFKG
jgi:hypothetical protein